MKKNSLMKILIAVVAVIVVGAVALLVTTKVLGGEEPTTQSSELVAPSASVPTGENAENAADASQGWNENDAPVQSVQVETTSPEMPDEAPGEVETLGEPELIDTENITKEERILLVVSAQHKLSASYVPHLEEIIEGSSIYLEAQAADAYMDMYAAALSQGLTLAPTSGYVSFDRQYNNHKNLAKKYVEMGYSEDEANALAARKILPAGCSEHNAGLALDFGVNIEDYENTAEYKWLVKNAALFGFIERYTYAFEDETGVEATPHHWRYVGSAELAQAINDSGYSFEDFMAYEYSDWAEENLTEESTALAEDDPDEEESEEETSEEYEDDYEYEYDEPEDTTEQVIIDLDAQ